MWEFRGPMILPLRLTEPLDLSFLGFRGIEFIPMYPELALWGLGINIKREYNDFRF